MPSLIVTSTHLCSSVVSATCMSDLICPYAYAMAVSCAPAHSVLQGGAQQPAVSLLSEDSLALCQHFAGCALYLMCRQIASRIPMPSSISSYQGLQDPLYVYQPAIQIVDWGACAGNPVYS